MVGYDPNNAPPLRAASGGLRQNSSTIPQRRPSAEGGVASLSVHEARQQPPPDAPRVLQGDSPGGRSSSQLNGQSSYGAQPGGESFPHAPAQEQQRRTSSSGGDVRDVRDIYLVSSLMLPKPYIESLGPFGGSLKFIWSAELPVL